jgi:hypothetical protein
MKPGDFAKYAFKVPKDLVSKVRQVLGPDAISGGVLRPTPDMPAERMVQLLNRSGAVDASPSRFPGLSPTVRARGTKNPYKAPASVGDTVDREDVDRSARLLRDIPVGSVDPEFFDLFNHGRLGQYKGRKLQEQEMQSRLRDLAVQRGINIDEFTEDFNRNVADYIERKPIAFERSQAALDRLDRYRLDGPRKGLEGERLRRYWIRRELEDYRRPLGLWSPELRMRL